MVGNRTSVVSYVVASSTLRTTKMRIKGNYENWPTSMSEINRKPRTEECVLLQSYVATASLSIGVRGVSNRAHNTYRGKWPLGIKDDSFIAIKHGIKRTISYHNSTWGYNVQQ